LSKNFFFILSLTAIIYFSSSDVIAQSDSIPTWDNQAYIGHKIGWGKNKWRYSGEIQARVENNFQNLDNWFIEGVATYLAYQKFEITPDFRFTVKPDKIEYRPGFGIVFKTTTNKFQLGNQLKWQMDINSNGGVEQGVRYVIFGNRKITEKLMATFIAGAFYRWRNGFNGFEFIRFGPGISIIFDKKNTLNLNYLVGVKNFGEYWQWSGIPVIQLSLNINKDYKYVPAKYFSL